MPKRSHYKDPLTVRAFLISENTIELRHYSEGRRERYTETAVKPYLLDEKRISVDDIAGLSPCGLFNYLFVKVYRVWYFTFDHPEGYWCEGPSVITHIAEKAAKAISKLDLPKPNPKPRETQKALLRMRLTPKDHFSWED